MNVNKCFIGGRLTAAPELKTTQNGTIVLRFSVAVNRMKKDETDFIECVAFKTTAENIAKYFAKGSSIFVEGHINIDSYKDKDGNKRKSVVVIVDRFDFVESKNKTIDATPDEPAEQSLEDIEDLPF